MDDPQAADPRPVLSLHGLHDTAVAPPGALPGVPPLRLVMHPAGLAIEVSRPDVVVGRHSTADVRLHLPDVSRRHCRLVYADGAWQVFDLHSLNGLYVNGEPVGQATLHHHDRLRIGGYQFDVELDESAPRRQAS